MSDPAIIDQRRADRAPEAEGAHDLAQPARSGIEIAIHHQFDSIGPAWREFEQNADCNGFQAFDWLATWCRHIGSLTQAQPAVVVAREGGAIVFILPLAVTPGAVRRLSWLGSDLCDYNGPLLAPDASSRLTPERFRDLWQDILRRLQADPRTRHDLVELTKMPERIGAQPNPLLALPVGLNPSHAYVSDLCGTWTEFYEAKRSSATRRRDRTKLKKLGEIGEVRFVTPQDRNEIMPTVELLMEQKAGSFARMGVANMFARPGWSEFFAAVAIDERSRHLIHVSRLDVGPVWAAINLGLVFRGTYCHVLASYDGGETARFGAGAAHLRELLRYSVEHGFAHFDFTIGDEPYKREWSDRTLVLYDHVAAASVRGHAAAAMMRGHRRLKRLIKQNDKLWSLFSRARAALGPKPAPVADEGAPKTVHKSPSIAPE
jgi:CelD/BcsL family acetyltransferase involved in cellulose biosynthesis